MVRVRRGVRSERDQEDFAAGTPVAIGLDLGSTNLKGGLVGPGGTQAHLESRETGAGLGYEGVLEEILRFVGDLQELVAERALSLVGIGIGAPGPLNHRTGVIEFAPNLGWRQVPLGKDLAKRSGVARVRLENDANAAAFAEAWVGEGTGARCLLGVTLGTGIGGGVVVDGRLFVGAGGAAAEIGHIVVRPGGRLCRCGNRGCVEAYFSGWALAERCRELAGEHPGHSLSLDDLGPEAVFEAWQRGDPLAARVVEAGLRAFALALAGSINLLNPDRVAFFGGLARSYGLFRDALLAQVEAHTLHAAFRAVRFGASKLAWAGVLGAGGLVLSGSPDL
jgi:glucokinase